MNTSKEDIDLDPGVINKQLIDTRCAYTLGGEEGYSVA